MHIKKRWAIIIAVTAGGMLIAAVLSCLGYTLSGLLKEIDNKD